MLWGCPVSVSSRLISFIPLTYFMLLDAAVYGMAHGSSISASLFDYLFHTIASYLTFIFEPAHLVNVEGRCRWVGL
jgi:hypothetical protein